jgi:hypothetical protein
MASALERAELALRVEVERQVQANGSYSGPANGSPNYVDTEIDYGLLTRAVLMAVRDIRQEDQMGAFDAFSYDDERTFTDMIDAILNEKDTTND